MSFWTFSNDRVLSLGWDANPDQWVRISTSAFSSGPKEFTNFMAFKLQVRPRNWTRISHRASSHLEYHIFSEWKAAEDWIQFQKSKPDLPELIHGRPVIERENENDELIQEVTTGTSQKAAWHNCQSEAVFSPIISR